MYEAPQKISEKEVFSERWSKCNHDRKYWNLHDKTCYFIEPETKKVCKTPIEVQCTTCSESMNLSSKNKHEKSKKHQKNTFGVEITREKPKRKNEGNENEEKKQKRKKSENTITLNFNKNTQIVLSNEVSFKKFHPKVQSTPFKIFRTRNVFIFRERIENFI